MLKGFIVSAIGSKQGKTLITMSLMNKLNSQLDISPFKSGPDYIDTQFHQQLLNKPSINLDLFMMDTNQVKWSFHNYAKRLSIVEGAMGYYDGIDKQISTYDIAKTINLPTILVISAEGAYSTLSALIMGMINYTKDNTIKGIIFNHVSSRSHYELITKQINKDHPDIECLGWVKKDISTIKSRHLGLDLSELNNTSLCEMTNEVCKHINIEKLMNIINYNPVSSPNISYPFNNINQKTLSNLSQKHLTIINDNGFSFLYHDNVQYLKSIFKNVSIISAIDDDIVPKDSDVVYIPGGYVETEEVYNKLNNANKFKDSLIDICSNNRKKVYAECAGLIYLANKLTLLSNNNIDMAGIVPMSFRMRTSRKRLGYYYAKDLKFNNIYKGHAFHYSEPVNIDANPIWKLSKHKDSDGEMGTWISKNICGTYLHTLFRANPKIIDLYLNIN